MNHVGDFEIFEVNNSDRVPEPRASVINVSFPVYRAENLSKNGPRVRLTFGDREYMLTARLAEVLAEELRVAAGLCKIGQDEYRNMIQSITEKYGKSDIGF